MEILDNKAVLIKTRNPAKYTVIPKSRIVEDHGNGGYTVAVFFGLDEMRVLKNLGVKKVLSPITRKYNWPGRYRPMEHQVDTASFLTLHRRAFCFNEPGCVDADTEYLSPTGWKRIADYNGGEVAQYHPETGSAEFVMPQEFVKLPCEDMVRIKTKYGLDQMLSPEHRTLIRSNAADKWCVMEAAEVLKAHDDWHAGAKRTRSRKTVGFSHMAIPTVFNIEHGTGLDLSEAQLRVQVAVIADGHFANSTTRCVVRLKRQRKVARLRALLSNAGIAYSEREQNTPTAQGFHVFTFNAPQRCKEFGQEFWSCNAAQRAVIGDEVKYWDGTVREGNKGVSFSTTSRASADFIQYVWASLGHTARITEDVRDHYRNGVCYTVQARGGAKGGRFGLLALKSRNKTTVSTAKSTDGFKYCFMVPSTFLLFRRNGCVFASGNTGKTLSALWAADYLMTRGEVRRVLILCPLSIMHSAWMGDIMNSVMHRSAVVAHHAQASRRIELVQGEYEFVIANYEGLNLISKEVNNDGRFDLVIVDEANAYKNPTTQRWKSLQSIIHPHTYLWMMTGTPASQSPVDAYGLAKLVNPNGVPKFYTAWRDKVMNKITQFKWAPKPESKKLVHEVLQPAIRFTKEQCLDLPPVTTVTREVALSPQQTKYYKLLKEQMLVQAAGETISAVNAGVMVSKLLQVSCIAYNTPVLTDKGWVPIQEVCKEDLVWDGCEFVRHEGLLPRGFKTVVDCFGVRMTPDHEVLTDGGWKKAGEILDGYASKRINRSEVRLPDSAVKERHERWDNEESAVAVSVRLRAASHTGESVSTLKASPVTPPLRVSTREQTARNDKNTPVSNMGEHEKALHKSLRQRLEELRRSRDNCLRQLGAKLRVFLGRYAEYLPPRSLFGSYRQQRLVLQTELSLGDQRGTVQQYAQKCLVGHAARAHDDSASGGAVRTKPPNIAPAREQGMAFAGSVDTRTIESVTDRARSMVYDIAYCGPRNRFVVMGDDGRPLIVHNCGAAYTDDKEVVEFDAAARLNVLMEVIEETDRKVIVFAMFRSSINTITTYLEKHGINTAQIHGDVSATKRGAIINDFQHTPNVRVLVMQPQATAHGITLTAADTVVFYGPLMSVEMYLQCIARADRKGQNSDKVTVVHIQSSPIEQKMFKAMASKVSDHALLVGMFDSELRNI